MTEIYLHIVARMADYIWTRTRRYNELVAKYENRESRQEDLDLQAELERRLREAEAEVSKVQEEMKYFKPELQNREQNFKETDFDSTVGAFDFDNPLHPESNVDGTLSISVTVTDPGPVDMEFEEVPHATASGVVVKLVKVGETIQKQHKSLCVGLYLTEVNNRTMEDTKLTDILPLQIQPEDTTNSEQNSRLDLVFLDLDGVQTGSTIMEASRTADRLHMTQSSANLSELMAEAL